MFVYRVAGCDEFSLHFINRLVVPGRRRKSICGRVAESLDIFRYNMTMLFISAQAGVATLERNIAPPYRNSLSEQAMKDKLLLTRLKVVVLGREKIRLVGI